MLLLVTGANGFLGQHVVREAVARGHRVRAMVRPTANADALPAGGTASSRSHLEIVRHDLRQRHGLVEHVRGADAVLHLAAAKTGDYYTQMAGTVVATENLLAAMHETSVDRLVLTSSFAVYDYMSIAIGGMVDETSRVESEPERRDAYCRTKLWQERLVREAVQSQGLRATVLRPGVVYAGPEHLWTDRLGVRVGGVWFAIGSHARLPLTHVDHCADAVVRAVECEAAVGQTLNLVDDEPPTQRRYRRALQRMMPARVVPVNWTMMRLGGWLLDAADRRLLGGQARLPAILRRRALHARCRPLRYTNQRAREVLGWSAPARWRDTIETAAGQRATPAPTPTSPGSSACPLPITPTPLDPKQDLSSSDMPCVSRT